MQQQRAVSDFIKFRETAIWDEMTGWLSSLWLEIVILLKKDNNDSPNIETADLLQCDTNQRWPFLYTDAVTSPPDFLVLITTATRGLCKRNLSWCLWIDFIKIKRLRKINTYFGKITLLLLLWLSYCPVYLRCDQCCVQTQCWEACNCRYN